MRPTILTIVLFLLVVLVQLMAPANAILSREWILRSGAAVKFRTAPVDPVDAFRGRYVALRFQDMSLPVASTTPYQGGKQVYALFETDADGFARLTGLSDVRPASGLYLAAQVVPDLSTAGAQRVRVELPFDRYYMEEGQAPAAEAAYLKANRPGQQAAYIVARLRDGEGVIEDLYIQDKPVRQFLRDSS